MKHAAADNESDGSLKGEFETFRENDQNVGSPLVTATTISREEHENAINKMKAELSETKCQRDDFHRQLVKKDKEANHAKQEVETLKKLMNHSTSLAVAEQRDNAVAAVTEKDMILQGYKTLIDSLDEELKKSRKREEKAIKALKNGMDNLRESMAAGQIIRRRLDEEHALATSNVSPTDYLLCEDLENCPPAEITGGVIKKLET